MFEGILQPTHLIIILVIVLVVFGPGKLPEIGGALGKSMNEFRRSIKAPVDSEPEPSKSATPVQTAAPAVCPSCKQEVATGSQFCNHCGAKVA